MTILWKDIFYEKEKQLSLQWLSDFEKGKTKQKHNCNQFLPYKSHFKMAKNVCDKFLSIFEA